MLQLLKYSVLHLKLWAIILLAFICLQEGKAQKPLKFSAPTTTAFPSQVNTYANQLKDKTSISATIIPFEKDGIYNSKSRKIGYTLRLVNKIKFDQFGSITMQITNSAGAVLYKETFPFSVRKKASFEKDYVFATGQFLPGYYVSVMNVSTNTYDDVVTYNFGYEPTKIVSQVAAPSDFVNFWDQAKRELASVNPNYVITPRPDLSSKKVDAYEVEYNSIDKGIIYGWLTVPKEGRTQSVLYKISDYQSELTPELRSNIAVLSINTRGTGSSNQNYNLAYDQLGVLNIRDKNRYVLKGIYMDALRGLDLITKYAGQMKLNTRRIVVSGSGLGASAAAALAALDNRACGIILENPSFIGMRDLINFGDGVPSIGFPASMFKNYYNSQRISKESIIKTLEYFDPVYFAPYINCPILTGFSLHNTNVPAQCVYTFIGQLRVNKKENYECKDCGNSLDKRFYGLKETWLKERFGQP
jgi:cephalosporin-C deacetylase